MRKENIGLAPSVIVSQKHLLIIAFMFISGALASLLLLPSPLNLIPFIIVGGAAFVILSIKYSVIGIFIYMILYFVRPQELFPNVAIFSYPYEKIVGIIVIANLVLDFAINGRMIKIFKMDKAVVGIIGVALVSIATALWVGWSWMNFQKFLKIVLVYFFLSRLVDTPGKFKWIVWLYIVSTAFIAISSTVNYYTGHFQTTMGIQRAVGMGEGAYADPNTMATTLVLGLPFMFYVARAYRSKLIKVFLWSLLFACLWTVIITGSRGGMLGSAFTLFLLAWNSRKKVIATVTVALLIFGALAVMPEQYAQRLTTITHIGDAYDESGAAESAQGRIKGLKVGFEILSRRPIAGVGIGCFSVYNHQNHGSSLNAHNLLGQVMGELGILGLGAFAFLIYMIFKHIKYIKSQYRSRGWAGDVNYYVAVAVMIATISMLFQGIFGHIAYRFNWYIYACFLAIIMNLVGDRIRGEDESKARVLSPLPGNGASAGRGLLPPGNHVE
jgi:probable O-glycosylation ligase (exosortase A-associated)